MTTTYRLEHYDGTQGTYDSFEEAVEAVFARYPSAQRQEDAGRGVFWASMRAVEAAAAPCAEIVEVRR